MIKGSICQEDMHQTQRLKKYETKPDRAKRRNRQTYNYSEGLQLHALYEWQHYTRQKVSVDIVLSENSTNRTHRTLHSTEEYSFLGLDFFFLKIHWTVTKGEKRAYPDMLDHKTKTYILK